MENVYVRFQQSKGLLNPLAYDVKALLSAESSSAYTAHEIDKLLNSATYDELKAMLGPYDNNEFAYPPSHIKALCSYLVSHGFLKHSKKKCSLINVEDDAFSL